MHMRGDGAGRTALASGSTGAPGGVGDVAEQQLIGFFIDRESLQEGFGEIDVGRFGAGAADGMCKPSSGQDKESVRQDGKVAGNGRQKIEGA
jgi:hypothetical protein